MSRETPRSAGTYIYCVGRAERLGAGSPPLGSPGLGGQNVPVRTVEHADLVAVVSDAQRDGYDVTRDNLVAHQRVVEEAMSRSDVLPVAFGTVARGDREVRDKLLDREHDELQRRLEYIGGRVELGLKVLWDRERLFSDIVAERADIRELRDRLAARPPDTAYFERIQLGELTEAAVVAKRDRDGEAILDALSPLAVDLRTNRLLTETMVLNASFLVERDRVEAFDAAVQRLGQLHADRLVFQYVGPLPPYSFVNLAVSWED